MVCQDVCGPVLRQSVKKERPLPLQDIILHLAAGHVTQVTKLDAGWTLASG